MSLPLGTLTLARGAVNNARGKTTAENCCRAAVPQRLTVSPLDESGSAWEGRHEYPFPRPSLWMLPFPLEASLRPNCYILSLVKPTLPQHHHLQKAEVLPACICMYFSMVAHLPTGSPLTHAVSPAPPTGRQPCVPEARAWAR